jgi:hypothetical protein
MSEEENSSKKSKNEASPSKSSEEQPIIPEEEISEDKYQLQSDPNSNILSNKLIQLLQECLLSPVNKFNKDIFYKYDKEKLLDKESIDLLDLEINNFKISFIEEQYKIIKELIAKYDLIKNLKNFSEEKTFSEELNKYDINSNIFSFIGPFNNKIIEVSKKEENENSNEIEQFLFDIMTMNYYNQKTALLEQNMRILNGKIEDLKNKNKIL